MLKQGIYCSNSIPLMPLCLKFKMAVSFRHHPSALAIFSKLASEISNIHFCVYLHIAFQVTTSACAKEYSTRIQCNEYS